MKNFTISVLFTYFLSTGLLATDSIELINDELTVVYQYLTPEDLARTFQASKGLRDGDAGKVSKRYHWNGVHQKCRIKNKNFKRKFNEAVQNNEPKEIIKDVGFLLNQPFHKKAVGFKLNQTSLLFGENGNRYRQILFKNLIEHIEKNVVLNNNLSLAKKREYLRGFSDSLMEITKEFIKKDTPRQKLAKVIAAIKFNQKLRSESNFPQKIRMERMNRQLEVEEQQREERERQAAIDGEEDMSVLTDFERRVRMAMNNNYTAPNLTFLIIAQAEAAQMLQGQPVQQMQQHAPQPHRMAANLANIYGNVMGMLGDIDEDDFDKEYYTDLSKIKRELKSKFGSNLLDNFESLSSLNIQDEAKTEFENNLINYYGINYNNQSILRKYGNNHQFMSFIMDSNHLIDQAYAVLNMISDKFVPIINESLVHLDHLPDSEIESEIMNLVVPKNVNQINSKMQNTFIDILKSQN